MVKQYLKRSLNNKLKYLASFLFLCLFLFQATAQSQSFSIVVQSEISNRTITGFYKDKGKFLVPFIDLTNDSKLLTIDSIDGIVNTLNNFEDFVFSSEALLKLDSGWVCYGKDRRFDKHLGIGFLNENYEIDKTEEFSTNGFFDFPLNSTVLDNHLYLSAVVFRDSLGEELRDNVLIKVDDKGEIKWKKYYNRNLRYTHPDLVKPSFDGNILVSSAVSSQDEIGRFAQLIKLDTSGQVIWEYYGDERMEGGAVRFANLSDSTIVFTYLWGELESDSLGTYWNRYPFRFVWIDQQGNVLRKRFIPYHWRTQLRYNYIEEGNGDYFFAMGSLDSAGHTGPENILTKFSNQGDTIWQRRYTHSGFDINTHDFYIDYIIEMKDGRIAIVSTISTATDYNKIWLYIVDSNGCFQADSCGRDITVNSHQGIVSKSELQVYPNPTEGNLSISSEEPIEEIRLLNSTGLKLHSWQSDQRKIEIRSHAPGIYYLEIIFQKGGRAVRKVVKE